MNLDTRVADAVLEGLSKSGLFFQTYTYNNLFRELSQNETQLWLSENPILSQGLDGRLNLGNPAAFRFFGYDVREFLGVSSIKLIPNDIELRRKREEAIKELLETGIPKYFFDSPRVRKNGSIVNVPFWVAFRYKIDGGYSFGSLILAKEYKTKDIKLTPLQLASVYTQLEKHRISIKKDDTLGELSIDSPDQLYGAEVGVISQTPTRSLNFCNKVASELFGYEEGELVGLSSEVLVPERLRRDRGSLFEKILLEDLVVRNYETVRLTKQGKEIPIVATIFRYEFSQGVYSIAAVVRNANV